MKLKVKMGITGPNWTVASVALYLEYRRLDAKIQLLRLSTFDYFIEFLNQAIRYWTGKQSTPTNRTCVYMYVCICICVWVCMYVCTYVRTYIRVYICRYVGMGIHIREIMYACMYVCTYNVIANVRVCSLCIHCAYKHLSYFY